MRDYDAIISLGGHCKPAWHIRERFGLSKAMPFDWWITGPESVSRLLASGASVLFHVENLELIWNRTSVMDKVWGVIHHHDFRRDQNDKIDPDLAGQLPALRQKYRFLFERMFSTCVNSQRTLFVHAVPATDAAANGADLDRIRAMAVRLHDTLLRLWPDKHVDLLLLDGGASVPDPIARGTSRILFDNIDCQDAEHDDWRAGAYSRMFDRQGLRSRSGEPTGPVLTDMLDGEAWV